MNKIYVLEIAKSNYASPRCPVEYTPYAFSTDKKRQAFFATVEPQLREYGIPYEMWETDVDPMPGTPQ